MLLMLLFLSLEICCTFWEGLGIISRTENVKVLYASARLFTVSNLCHVFLQFLGSQMQSCITELELRSGFYFHMYHMS